MNRLRSPLAVLLCSIAACTSPLDIDTPRARDVHPAGDSLAVDTARVSVALVFDASGSMSGAGNVSAIRGAWDFVDSLDGSRDEAAVLWFSNTVTVRLGITRDKDSLRAAILDLPVMGSTALWDGTWEGIRVVAAGAANTATSVIVFTDGMDNSSSRTANDIIALAQGSGVSVFYLGFGSQVAGADLEAIAAATGGTYTDVTPATVTAAYRELLATLRKHR